MIWFFNLASAHPAHLEADHANFMFLGVEHIWTGYDHLLFLFALLLRAERARDIAMVVTTFTLAHSITLSAAAIGYLKAPPSIVEPAIAATIIVVGLENLRTPSVRSSVVATLGLGLIHGFGFAGVLAEVAVPRHELLSSLLLFNLGVETGQLSLVLIAMPALLRLRTYSSTWTSIAVPSLSVGISCMGFWWLLQRI